MNARVAAPYGALLIAGALAALSFLACGGGGDGGLPATSAEAGSSVVSDAGSDVTLASGDSGGGPDAGNEAGSGSDSRSASGIDAASDSGSSPGSDSGPRDSGASSTGQQRVPSNVIFNDAGVTLCGSPCPLTANVCCIDLFGNGQCVPKGKSCPARSAVFTCVQQTDCPSSQICCGVADKTAQTAGSVCQDVSATGNKCTPVATSSSATQGSAQLCQTNAECKTGNCVWQDCNVGSLKPSLTMCGIQSAAPFNCVAH